MNCNEENHKKKMAFLRYKDLMLKMKKEEKMSYEKIAKEINKRLKMTKNQNTILSKTYVFDNLKKFL
jgi:DNA-directed RNA polymerase delta subunit